MARGKRLTEGEYNWIQQSMAMGMTTTEIKKRTGRGAQVLSIIRSAECTSYKDYIRITAAKNKQYQQNRRAALEAVKAEKQQEMVEVDLEEEKTDTPSKPEREVVLVGDTQVGEPAAPKPQEVRQYQPLVEQIDYLINALSHNTEAVNKLNSTLESKKMRRFGRQ